MRHLTLTGFLESYVRALGGGTLALPKLVERSRSEPRLVEPLLLWAVTTDRADRLEGLLEDWDDLRRELGQLRALQEAGSLESALAAETPELRAEYSKAWRSYVVRRDAATRDAELRLEARKRVLSLETQKDVTRYRMAKDLGINPGNLHAFLAQGDPTKLSLDKVAALLKYLEVA
ncbi:MAG: hypothetical protein PF636_05440 [Actinomycetota bacterium]|jgi:hypothetical protein|nr:hypothetical protein [Actinomycetota bacterium]